MKNNTSRFASMRPAAKTALVMAALAALVLPALALADTLTRQLETGMRGADVSTLQTFLAQDNTIYPQGLVTGYFGSLTKSAVSNFQARNGIATVGRVGPQTLGVINSQMGNGLSLGTNKHAPTIGYVSIGTSASTANLSWNTDEAASALVYYGTSPLGLTEANSATGVTVYGASTIANINLQTAHGASLTGLQANTTYYYVVYVRDGEGNESVTWPTTFRTGN